MRAVGNTSAAEITWAARNTSAAGMWGDTALLQRRVHALAEIITLTVDTV